MQRAPERWGSLSPWEGLPPSDLHEDWWVAQLPWLSTSSAVTSAESSACVSSRQPGAILEQGQAPWVLRSRDEEAEAQRG